MNTVVERELSGKFIKVDGEIVLGSAGQFLFRGGYADRLLGLEPQQPEDADYKAGYAQAVCDLIGSPDYVPVRW